MCTHPLCFSHHIDASLKDRPDIMRLIEVFCRGKHYNAHGTFDYLANVIFNITQLEDGRALFLKESSEGL